MMRVIRLFPWGKFKKIYWSFVKLNREIDNNKEVLYKNLFYIRTSYLNLLDNNNMKKEGYMVLFY